MISSVLPPLILTFSFMNYKDSNGSFKMRINPIMAKVIKMMACATYPKINRRVCSDAIETVFATRSDFYEQK